MKNVEYIKLSNSETMIIARENSNTVIVPSELISNEKELLKQLKKEGFFNMVERRPFSVTNNQAVYLSLHASSACNLKCKYCFLPEKNLKSLSIDSCKSFIDLILNAFPGAEKYIVDPTGSAEPLLELDKILAIADYCKGKSDEINREILVMLVTNGTLLTQEVIKSLGSRGIIFGVSLDGLRKTHDKMRVKPDGSGSFSSILDNLKQTKDPTLIGAAVTLQSPKQNLVKILKYHYQFFRAISIKPVRNFETELITLKNIAAVKKQYSKLTNFLLKETLNKEDFKYLQVLINGDDYFGKFILRCAVNFKVQTRCDAGVSRFSLAPDESIYACPGSINIAEMKIGTLKDGIDLTKMEDIWSNQSDIKKCKGCSIRYVCGGECMVVSYYKNNDINGIDEVMCEFKKHLFFLATYLVREINKHPKMRVILDDFCNSKLKRFTVDQELDEMLKLLRGEYTFTELKKIKDEKTIEWLALKEKYFSN